MGSQKLGSSFSRLLDLASSVLELFAVHEIHDCTLLTSFFPSRPAVLWAQSASFKPLLGFHCLDFLLVGSVHHRT
jgi:hypothetical protein